MNATIRLIEAWSSVASPELARQTMVTSFRDGVVTIGVGNACLLHEVGGFRRRELLEKLRARVPDLYIRDLRFRARTIERSDSTMNTATSAQKQAVTTKTSAPVTPFLDTVLTATCAKLDELASGYCRAIANAAGQVSRAMLLADGIENLRRALTPDVMNRFMKLQGSRLGFKTDKDDEKGYPEDVVRECLVEAFLLGVLATGNEFNIIAGACYVTREGYDRLVREIAGLKDLELIPGVPQPHNGQTVIRFAARWKYQGIPGQLTDGEGKPGRVFAIRVNQKMGTEAIIGKSFRKALKAIYEQVLGSEHTIPDADDEERGTAAVNPSSMT